MNLSIKNAPEALVERLRRRAERNHRSLQGELLAIIEAAALDTERSDALALLAEVRKLGRPSPSESAAIVRADRNRDEGR